MSTDQVTTVQVAFDDYPQTKALKSGAVKSSRYALKFSDIKPANRFFKPMVREQKFDVSEMAIGTFLMAKAYGKPLVLLPATIMGRFQQGTMLCRAADALGPGDLAGKTIGVRSYSQTTAIWVRGFLANDYGIDLGTLRWVVFEEGHVAEYKDPPGVVRAGTDKNMLQMLRDGEIDAAIYGADLPNDSAFKPLIADAEGAAAQWYAKHKVVPINHMVVATEKFVKSNPDAVREVFRLLVESKKAAGLPKPGSIDFLPFGLAGCRPALETVINYEVQQQLLPKRFAVDELFDETTRALGS
jgi:4,5-dihydroxyphthalate decarboxylase